MSAAVGPAGPVGGAPAGSAAAGSATAGSATAGSAVGGTAGDSVAGVDTRPIVPSTAFETSWAALDDEMVTLCVSGPSSPGLRTRTEIEMLHAVQPAPAGPPASAPQFQFQFQSQPPVAGPGLPELVPSEGSEQFQFQFHVQFDGGVALGSELFGLVPEVFCTGLTDGELILPLSPP